MKKKEFQNLPSTDTPITAENLNEMQSNIEESCVVVSPTEPTTNEKVWIQKGKNLLNTKNILEQTLNGVTISKNEDGTITLNGTCTNGFALVLLNDIFESMNNTYTFSLKVNSGTITGKSMRFSINNSTSSSPVNTEARLLSFILDISGTSGSDTQNISDTAQYLSAYINTGCIFDNCNISLQLEQGSETEYEAYVEKAIKIKNSNNVYEEFYKESKINKTHYSTEEQVIGTWLDGKPLYRKVIKATTPSVIDTNTNIYTITESIKDVIKVDGYVYAASASYKGSINSYIADSDYIATWILTNSSGIPTNIRCRTANRLSCEIVIILEYTKTTD